MRALFKDYRALPFLITIVLLLSFASAYAFDSTRSFSHSKADSELLDVLSQEYSVLAFVTMKDGVDARSLNVPVVKPYSFGVAAVQINTEQLGQLIADDNVIRVEHNKQFNLLLQDAVRIVNATPSHFLQSNQLNLTGMGQSVCVIDTGVDFSHPDLARANVAQCTIDCSRGEVGCFRNCSAGDTYGHGTHVAGIVAADGGIKGIAPNAGVVSVKVFPDHSAGTTLFEVLNGMEWCVLNANDYNISVLSLSLGAAYFPDRNSCDGNYSSLSAVVREAVQGGISVVASTGNEGLQDSVRVPACLTGVIPVGATDKQDLIADFSNYAGFVKLFAPGDYINSTFPLEGADPFVNCGSQTGSGYCVMSGTSMSAPMISGALAILNQYTMLNNYRLNPQSLEDILYNGGIRVEEPPFRNYYGYNFSRIDIYRALLFLDREAPALAFEVVERDSLYEFSCNASDWQLINLTLRVRDLTNIINETHLSFDARLEGNISLLVDAHNGRANGRPLEAQCIAQDAQGNTRSREIDIVYSNLVGYEIKKSSNRGTFYSEPAQPPSGSSQGDGGGGGNRRARSPAPANSLPTSPFIPLSSNISSEPQASLNQPIASAPITGFAIGGFAKRSLIGGVIFLVVVALALGYVVLHFRLAK